MIQEQGDLRDGSSGYGQKESQETLEISSWEGV